MKFEHDFPVDLGSGYKALETAEHLIRWKGLLFVRGHAAGEESAARLAAEFRRGGPVPALSLAKGSFALCLFEKDSGDAFCLVDPFGLHRLFLSERNLGVDFFALLRRLGPDSGDCDRAALAAFLRFGFCTGARTFDRRVRVLTGNEIAVCRAGGSIDLLEKAAPVSGAGCFDFDAYIADVSSALVGQKISLDLTGGFDSRLVAASLLHAGTPIAEAVTSGQEGNRDIAIAEKIAVRLGVPHIRVRHDISGFEERAKTLLHLTQGQMGVLTYDHMYQIQQGRLARGMDLGMGGAGGELWKDFLWLQDFPRLRGSPDFAKLYKRRFEPRPPSAAGLSPEFSGLFESAGSEYLAEMTERFADLPRTEAYDCLYADMRLPYLLGPPTTAAATMGVAHFSPLLDRDGVAAAMRWPHSKRLFSRWHRRTISRMAPQIAKERTTDGFSARIGLAAAGDVPFYIADKARRAVQKLAQHFNWPDVVSQAVEDPQTLPYARNMSLATDALQKLATLGVLSEGVTPDRLSRLALDRALTAGLVLLEMLP